MLNKIVDMFDMLKKKIFSAGVIRIRVFDNQQGRLQYRHSCTYSFIHQTISYRSFKHVDECAFIQDLSLVPWEGIQSFYNDEMVEIWNSLFLEVVNKPASHKCHRIKRKLQPDWITPEILDYIKERNKFM